MEDLLTDASGKMTRSIEAFKKEMDAAKVDYRYINYPGAVHAFTNPEATEKGKQFNLPLAYHPEADKQSKAEAAKFLRDVVANGGKVLFVGTKRQAQEIVGREASRAGAFYLNRRWVGGLITNFDSVKKNIVKMEDLSQKIRENKLSQYTKKEQLLAARELAKLENDIGGLKGMRELPQAMVLASIKSEEIAASEARQRGIPLVGIADTNADPAKVSYPIPGNDDATASIEIIMKALADACKK